MQPGYLLPGRRIEDLQRKRGWQSLSSLEARVNVHKVIDDRYVLAIGAEGPQSCHFLDGFAGGHVPDQEPATPMEKMVSGIEQIDAPIKQLAVRGEDELVDW